MTMLFAFGCSSRKSKPTQLHIHPANWTSEHPNFIFANNLQSEYGQACKSCHGEDYTGGTSGYSCVGCHNQRPDVCTGCHGGFAGDTTGAPPYSLARGSLFSDRGVGGHPAMVNGSSFFAGTDCQTCHPKPVFVLSSVHFSTATRFAFDLAGHLQVFPGDGRAEVAFSGLARLFYSRYGDPVFDPDSGTCSNVYCHGAFPGGDTAHAMNFYGSFSQVFCGSCHAVDSNFASLSGRHKTHNLDSLGIACVTCHFSTVDSANSIRLASGRHVNGFIGADVVFDPSVDTLGIGLFDGVSCSGMPDSPACHANRRDW